MSLDPLLEMQGISKTFNGLRVLKNVGLKVYPGEIHALMGENGAGKSTLMKILSGAERPGSGEISIGGERIANATPHQMIELGVAVIYQELMQAPHLTVAENVFLGRLPRTRFGIVDWRRLHRECAAITERLGFRVDPSARLRDLSVAQRQMVEIASALSRNARIVVLDEPSAALGGSELERLFGIIRSLAGEGVGFIYISHRLREVFSVCDRVTVLRDGSVVGSRPVGEVDTQTLIGMMVGRELADIFPKRNRRPGEVALAVEGLSRGRWLHDIDLEVRTGEIMGICGLAGSGRTELLRALVGADVAENRAYRLHGKPFRAASPRSAIRQGISLLPEDRKTEGCFLPQSVGFNVTISRLDALRRRGFLSGALEQDVVGVLVRRLNIRTPTISTRIEQLSGGNQQKCMIARSLNARCAVLLIDEPTRGVDVGAKQEIYQLLAHLADVERAAIVMVSSELPEILGISDRIVVMRDGRIAGRFEAHEATEETLMAAAVSVSELAA